MKRTIDDVYKTAPVFQALILPLVLFVQDRLPTLLLWRERRRSSTSASDFKVNIFVLEKTGQFESHNVCFALRVQRSAVLYCSL